jgi:hypothetical protein
MTKLRMVALGKFSRRQKIWNGTWMKNVNLVHFFTASTQMSRGKKELIFYGIEGILAVWKLVDEAKHGTNGIRKATVAKMIKFQIYHLGCPFLNGILQI